MDNVLLILLTSSISMALTYMISTIYYRDKCRQYIMLDKSRMPPQQVRDWSSGKCKVTIRFVYPALTERHLKLVKEETVNDKKD